MGPPLIYVGVDLGQKRDPTAIVVTELVEEWPEPDPWTPRHLRRPRQSYYAVRFLTRLPLGTPYTQVVDQLQEIVARIKERAPKAFVRVVLDATGVGQPVLDLVRERLKDVAVTGVILGAGERAELGLPEARVGKAYLVSRLQVLLQTGRLRLPRTPEGLALVEELLNFEIRVDQAGQDRYGAFKVGTHDDLVVALGLSVLYDASYDRVQYGPPLFP